MSDLNQMLSGKVGLIMGLANDKSISWGIAKVCNNHGAEFAISYQNEILAKRVRPLAEELKSDLLIECDISDEASVDKAFELIKKRYGKIDFFVHAIAFSDKNELQGRYVDTSRGNFLNTLDISCYSFVYTSKKAAEILKPGGSILTLTYYGSEKVIPNYNVMGIAKAALESSVKYIAADLGELDIRVNAISAGPIKTLAASGIGDFRSMLKFNEENSPLRRNVTIYDVGNTAAFLLSDLSSNITGEIKEVNIKGSDIEGKLANGEIFTTLSPRFYPQLIDDLRAQNIKINIVPIESTMGNILGIIFSWLPMIVLIGIWIYYLKNMQGAGGKAMGFGKSKAKLMQDQSKKVTFADVAGIDEAKEELKEVVDFLKNPAKFDKLGGKIPKGCLLIGSPGTGKTLLARAVAGEAGVPFFTISGSDFVEMFVGVGASRVRDMFTQAKKHAPCIVFIDEIDAVGRHRGSGHGGGNDEREQTLNQLLVEMDGFADNQGIIVVAATNRPDVLDSALLRPGRFDRQITVPIPDIKGREQILQVHIKKVAAAPDVDVKVIARGTPGFTGADLANLINEATLVAAKLNREVVTMQELEHAKDKVMMGAERRSMVMSEGEKKITAYHEGGHALVSLYVAESDPIHKATIIPRGRALGMVMQLPESDRCHYSKAYLEARLAIAMGGRVAEEVIFGKEKITTGASNDIKVATSMAKNMITKWGFSEKIGPIMVGEDREDVMMGFGIEKSQNISGKLAETVDKEVDRLLRGSYKIAKDIIIKHKKKLEILAKALIEYETITGDEIKDLLSGKKIRGNGEKSEADGKNYPTSSVPNS